MGSRASDNYRRDVARNAARGAPVKNWLWAGLRIWKRLDNLSH